MLQDLPGTGSGGLHCPACRPARDRRLLPSRVRRRKALAEEGN